MKQMCKFESIWDTGLTLAKCSSVLVEVNPGTHVTLKVRNSARFHIKSHEIESHSKENSSSFNARFHCTQLFTHIARYLEAFHTSEQRAH